MCQIQTYSKGSALEELLVMHDYYVREEEKDKLKDSLFDISKIPQKKHADRALFISLGYLAANGDHLVYIKSFLTAAELLDESILIDDDIIDKSNERLGKSTIHKENGIDYALLMSNDILHKSLKLFTESALTAGKPATIIPFLEMSKKINDGQYYDIKYSGKPPKKISINEYIELVRLTTGIHIGDSLMIGAMLAGSGNGELFRLMNNVGESLGITGQIYDDIIDWFPEVNKTKGSFSDYNGRKARLPYLIAIINPKTKEKTLEGFTNDKKPTDLRPIIFTKDNYKKMKELFNTYSEKTLSYSSEIKKDVGMVLNELIDVYKEELNKVEKYIIS